MTQDGTAYHEAGHAVVGIVYELPPKRVSIKPRGDSGGHCLRDTRTFQARLVAAKQLTTIARLRAEVFRINEAWVVPLLAGEAAEAKYRQRRGPVRSQWDMKRLLKQWRADYEEVIAELSKKNCDATVVNRTIGHMDDLIRTGEAVEPLAEALGMKAISVLTTWFRRTDEVIAEQWPAVRALAAALLRKNTLTGKEVARIIAGKMKVVEV